MKSFELFRFYHDTLARKRDALRAEVEAADDADRAAWAKYEALTEAEYDADRAKWDSMVQTTSARYARLRDQLASIEDAITYAARLEEELDFLEGEGVLARD